ncbi:MAG: MerR family transcriptional regulator [Chloroflexota bacterium]|nr:MerR family transcriptional regulator [Chloroflexota bacterium]
MVSIAEFSKNPKYTIKVVSERSGVRAVTLRAWERRYDLLEPERLDNNYRLYSERDIEVIRWITNRLDDGLSISNAVREYKNLQENDIWPDALPSILPHEPSEKPDHAPDVYAKKLFTALTTRNETEAKQIIDSVQRMFALKVIFFDILSPCLYEIGEAWYRGEIRIAIEHYASAFIRGILLNLLRSFPIYNAAPILLVGCGPEEFHEIASLMLSVLLRREGYQVEFLGQDLPIDDLVFYAEDTGADMIVLSISSELSARPLYKMQAMLDELPKKPKLGFGGRYFNENMNARKELEGVFLGETLDEGVQHVHDILD